MTQGTALHRKASCSRLLTLLTVAAALVAAGDNLPPDSTEVPGDSLSQTAQNTSSSELAAGVPGESGSDPGASVGGLTSDEGRTCPATPHRLELPLECEDTASGSEAAPDQQQPYATESDCELGSEGRPAAAERERQDQPTEEFAVDPILEEIDELEEDRHNFASVRNGAKLVAANKEAKKAAAVLDSDADTFCKNDCRADKWYIIELSQLIKADTLELSQFELYSSRVHEFEVRGRQNHPRHDGNDYSKNLNSSQWKLLGRFEAANSKGTQAFKIPSPTWIKYLQLHFFTHHGGEPVCALNDVLLYGKSAADDLEDQLAMESILEPQPTTQPEPASQAPAGSALHHGQPPSIPPPPAAPDSGSGGSSGPNAVPDSTGNNSTQQDVLTAPANLQAVPTAELSQPPQPINAGAMQSAAEQQAHSILGHPPAVAPVPDMPTAPQAVATESVYPSVTLASPELTVSTPSNAQPVILTAEAGALGGAEVLDSDGLLLIPSQGKPGGSVFDILVTELRGLKLQQKSLSRSFAALEQNMSAAVEALGHALGTLALDVSMLERRYSEPAVAALEGPAHEPGDQQRLLSMRLAELHQVQRRTWFRESALLSVVAMFGGAALATWLSQGASEGMGGDWGRVILSRSVLVLAVANGVFALLLQLHDGLSFTVPSR